LIVLPLPLPLTLSLSLTLRLGLWVAVGLRLRLRSHSPLQCEESSTVHCVLVYQYCAGALRAEETDGHDAEGDTHLVVWGWVRVRV
jgi:hypothetical protein